MNLTSEQLRYIAKNQIDFERTISKILHSLADAIEDCPSKMEAEFLREVK